MQVRILYDKAMISYPDREAPLGEYDILNPEITEWLNSRISGFCWDFDFLEIDSMQFMEFQISEPKIALLFKLTWG